jgi:hypothetical protein
MVAHHLLSIVTKIGAFYLHVTIHIQWSQMMNLYLLIFFLIQYIFSFATILSHATSLRQLKKL